MIYLLIPLSVISGILYRCGGSKYYNTKYRDFGCPAIFVIAIIFACKIQVAWWVHFLSFGLMFGAMTTYCKWINKLWEKEKPSDVLWYHWALTGLLYGFSAILYALFGDGLWLALGVRMAVLGVTVWLWSVIISNPVWEECGRGGLFIASLFLLSIL